MERTSTHYRVRDSGVTLPSSYYADRQFFGKEIVMAMASRVWLWDSILVRNLQWLLCWPLFTLKYCARKKCAFAVNIEFRTHEDRQGITSNGLVADPFSISCYMMPIRVILLVMDTFGAGAAHVFGLMWHCSRFQFSCSCSQCTCHNSLKLCWLRLKCASISELFHLSLELSLLLSEWFL